MADTKVSALTDGTTLDATDRIPVARSPFGSGDNRYVTGTEIITAVRGTDLAAIEALTTTAYGRSLLELADETALEALLDTLPNLTSIQSRTVTLADAGFDVLFGWDDSGSAYKNFALADITAEGTPASGDFFLMYGAEGDLRKVDFDDMPAGGSGISDVVEDTSPQLGGTLDANTFSIGFDDATGILDDSGNEQLLFQKTASAVNYFEFTNSAAGNWPILGSAGGDTNVGMEFRVQAGGNGERMRFDLGTGAPVAYFRSTNAGALGPRIATYHNSSSPVANDTVGAFFFDGNDDAAALVDYAGFSGLIIDPSASALEGQLVFNTAVANNYVSRARLGAGFMLGSGTPPADPGDGNIAFNDSSGLFDSNGNELVIFKETSSAANYLEIENSPDWYPVIRGAGSDAQVGIVFEVKGDMGDGLSAYEFYCGTGNAPQIRLWSEGDEDEGPWLNFRNGGEPVAGNICGHISMGGGETGFPNSHQIYSYLVTRVLDPTPGSEDGELTIATPVNGSNLLTPRIKIADGVIIGSSSVYPGVDNLRVTAIELGHDTANTLTASSGVLSVESVPVAMTGKQTIWVPASAMTPRTTSGAAATTREINSITIAGLAFDQSADEGANFVVTFPKSWNASTVTYKAHWTTTGGGSAETVQFELRGGSFANDAAINVTGLGTAVALSDTWIADDDVHITAESSAVTLSNAAVDVPTYFEIIRDVSDDDLTADAELIGVEIFYSTSAGNDA
jgi:hypothetical protein